MWYRHSDVDGRDHGMSTVSGKSSVLSGGGKNSKESKEAKGGVSLGEGCMGAVLCL